MKNKEVIIFLIISLVIVSPIVAADNFLSGYSILDKAGNFFKGIFSKEKVGGITTEGEGTELPGGPGLGTTEGDEGEGTELPGGPGLGTPTLQTPSLRLRIEEDIVTLTWNNIFTISSNGPTGGAILNNENTIQENNFFINTINLFKSLFNKKTIGTEFNEREYRIAVIDKNNNQIAELIIRNIDERCNSNNCIVSENIRNNYEYYYKIKAKVGNIESEYSNRVGPVNYCGDNKINGEEQCDGRDLNGQTCQDLEYNGGTLSCNQDCTFNTNNCNPFETGTPPAFAEFTECQSKGGVCKDICSETEIRTQDSCGITLQEIRCCIPTFILTINKNIENGGVISTNPLPHRGKYNTGTQITLTVTINQGYKFKEWRINNEFYSNQTTINIIINSNIIITAIFEQTEELICDDGIDNDKDGIIDNLDLDCSTGNNGLQITNLDISGTEFYKDQKISVIECSYQIISQVNPQNVIPCINLTLNDIDMQCAQKTSQQNLIKFLNCNTGEAGVNKLVKCDIIDKCNRNTPSVTADSIPINVIEYSTCEAGKILPEYLGNLRITKPTNNKRFEKGEDIEIEVKAENRYKNEEGQRESIDIAVMTSLVDMTSLEEVEISDTVEEEVNPLGEKTFKLNLTIPDDLEVGDYKLYTKAYIFDEEEICSSTDIDVKIIEVRGGGGEECTDEDDDSFCEEDEDCDDSDSEINPEAEEICTDGIDNNCNGLTDYADSACQTIPGQERGGETGPEIGGEEISQADSDNDGLPDYWEYNYFGDLSQGPNDDFDNDGVTNINEYIGNTNPKVPNNKKSSLLTVLLIILGIGILTLAAVFIIKKIKNKRKFTSSNLNYKPSIYSLDSTNQNKLQQYIQQAKSQGMKKEDIKKTLLNAGWKEQDIDRLL